MTRKTLLLAPLGLAALSLGGCDWFSGTTGSRSTDMRNVEILPGTASDEMVTLDQAAGEGTAIDPSLATGPAPVGADGNAAAVGANGAATSKGNSASDAAPPSDERDEAAPNDTVIRPPAATPGAVAK